MSEYKLGLLPPDHSRPALMLGDFLKAGVIPEIPEKVDYISGASYSVYDNNVHGTCGPISVASNRRGLTTKLLGKQQTPTLADIHTLYRLAGNPRFDPNLRDDDPSQQDNGVNMQTMLSQLLKYGLGGVKPLAFAKVDSRNLLELRQAISLFGYVLFGIDLQKAQQNQNEVWDYSRSSAWGGHAVTGGAATTNGVTVVTWGETRFMTDKFIQMQSSESWVIVWSEMLSDTTFLKGIDFRGLQSAFTALTGKKFPEWQLPPGIWDLI